MALSYDVCVNILYDHPGFLSATERGSANGCSNSTAQMHEINDLLMFSLFMSLQRLCRDCTKTAQS